MKYPHILVALILLAIINPSFSQKEDTLTNEASMKLLLESVDVLGIRPIQESKVKSDLQTMELMSHDAGSILTRIPAINGIRKGGGYGYDPVLRGFKYDQLAILIDGIQTTTVACPNRMDPPTSQVAVNALSSVEVRKGPYSLRYGNNIGGSINFISTKTGAMENGVYARMSTGYESNGSVFRSEAMAGVKRSKTDYQILGSWHKGSNYKDGNGDLVPAAFQRANFGFNMGYRPNENQEIKARITRNFARNALYAALPMDLRTDDTWLLHAEHSMKLGVKKQHLWHSSAYISLVDHYMDNLDKNLDPRTVNASTSVKTANRGFRTELQYNGSTYDIRAGLDHTYENARGYRSREFLMGPNTGLGFNDNVWQNAHIRKTGTYVEYRKSKDKLRFNLSGRLNLNFADAADLDASFNALYESTASTQINPGITGGISYFGKKFSTAFWAGRVQRSGNLSERFMNSFPVGLDPYELIGNPLIKPEVNNQTDLIFKIKPAENSKLEINFFYSYLQNYISSTIREDLSPKMPSAPGVRQYTNIDKASISGLEISYIQGLPANLTFQMSSAFTIGKNLTNDEALPEIPPLDIRVSLHGSYLENRLQPAINFRYVAQQSRISAEFGETETASFFLTDFDISYKAFNALTISTGIRNLFDIAYYEHLNRSIKSSGIPIYDPGRNIFLGLVFEFK